MRALICLWLLFNGISIDFHSTWTGAHWIERSDSNRIANSAHILRFFSSQFLRPTTSTAKKKKQSLLCSLFRMPQYKLRHSSWSVEGRRSGWETPFVCLEQIANTTIDAAAHSFRILAFDQNDNNEIRKRPAPTDEKRSHNHTHRPRVCCRTQPSLDYFIAATKSMGKQTYSNSLRLYT